MKTLLKPTELFAALMKLVDSNIDGKFFFNDHESLTGETFRVFSYHIASYSDWLVDGALEARGVMFQIDDDGEMIRIVSRPMEKFFNLNENPFTMDLDLTETVSLMDKADGSLISTYLTEDTFALKSKTSIFSNQAIAANRYIKQSENAALWEFCYDLAMANYTVNMEWCSPDNRIVLEYPEAQLIILNIRDNTTGEYLDLAEIPIAAYQRVKKWMVVEYDPAEAHVDGYVERVRAMKGIEGMIGRLSTGQSWKLKTAWYVDLHAQKDSVNVPKKLVTTILNNNHDDLYALFADDTPTIERIREFESHVVRSLRASFEAISSYYTPHRHVDRKTFAVEGMKKLKPWEFGVAMKAYQNKTMQGVHELLVDVYLRKPELLIPEKYLNEVK